jgi:hypothetical protein
MKGIGWQVVPYVVEDFVDESGATSGVVNEHTSGLDLFLDANAVDERNARRVRAALQDAIAAVDARHRRAVYLEGDAADIGPDQPMDAKRRVRRTAAPPRTGGSPR